MRKILSTYALIIVILLLFVGNSKADSIQTQATMTLSTNNMRPTLVDDTDVRIAVHSFTYGNGKSVYSFNVLFENYTDKKLYLMLVDVVIDGFDIPTTYGKMFVDAGQRAICSSSIWEKDLKVAGITDWSHLDGFIEVREESSGNALYTVPIKIEKACWEYEGIYSQENSIQEIIPTGKINIPQDAAILSEDNPTPLIFDTDNIKISASSYEYDNSKTIYQINFVLDNQSNNDLNLNLTDVVIEGFEISTTFENNVVKSNHKAVCSVFLRQKDLNGVGIKDWVVLSGKIELRKDWGGKILYTIPVVIYKNAWEPSILSTEDSCMHQWIDASCKSPRKCSLCDATEGEKLPHTPSDSWKIKSTDYVSAETIKVKTCTTCGETVSFDFGKVTKMHDGAYFLIPPKDFTTRLGSKLSSYSGNTYSTASISHDNEYTCEVLNGSDLIAVLKFAKNDDMVLDLMRNTSRVFNKIIGFCGDDDAIVRLSLALVETIDPSLSFSQAKDCVSKLLDDESVTVNGITYILYSSTDGFVIGLTLG